MQFFYFLFKDAFYPRLIGALLILTIFLVGRRLLSRLVIKLLSKVEIKHNRADISLFDTLYKPFNYLFIATGIYLALAVSPLVSYVRPTGDIAWFNTTHIHIAFLPISLLHKLYQTIFISLITWTIYDLEFIYEGLFGDFNDRFSLTDNTLLIRFLAKILRTITLIIGNILALIVLFPPLKSIFTGVGIGGVAVAFVSKDSLNNILSGILLMMDKPFVIDDWIEVGNIEGIVEDISLRSTRIRTFTQGVVVIPNATISNDNIINWSRMEKRRVKFDLGIAYQTSLDRLNLCIHGIESILNEHPLVENDTYLVTFDNFGDYALNIQILYFSLHTSYSDYVKVKEAINLKILSFCEANHIEIAFPTQTLIMQH